MQLESDSGPVYLFCRVTGGPSNCGVLEDDALVGSVPIGIFNLRLVEICAETTECDLGGEQLVHRRRKTGQTVLNSVEYSKSNKGSGRFKRPM